MTVRSPWFKGRDGREYRATGPRWLVVLCWLLIGRR